MVQGADRNPEIGEKGWGAEHSEPLMVQGWTKIKGAAEYVVSFRLKFFRERRKKLKMELDQGIIRPVDNEKIDRPKTFLTSTIMRIW